VNSACSGKRRLVMNNSCSGLYMYGCLRDSAAKRSEYSQPFNTPFTFISSIPGSIELKSNGRLYANNLNCLILQPLFLCWHPPEKCSHFLHSDISIRTTFASFVTVSGTMRNWRLPDYSRYANVDRVRISDSVHASLLVRVNIT
jgi:hypothetical protein